ncbi:PPIA [Symbiodinium natans]|uniref:PPIA protein n=1 Tax=Symbiodinium natans TaxID=878477 RepID=A0A812SES1_9DINO|nr:PPIA [Symbiodinium natans]
MRRCVALAACTSAMGYSFESHVGCSYSHIYPEQYVAYKTSELFPGSLDGDLTKKVWEDVVWTKDFVDISTHTQPRLRTRAKMRWDDRFLYIGAELQEPQPWATLTAHDSVIFQDNDFEVFVDANATTHFYKEFEMNAFNTTWELCLNKPYGDGGYENSTRVYGSKGWTMEPPLRCAANVQPLGALNNPKLPGERWTVEIALPLASLAERTGARAPPRPGDFWRASFSRVQWAVKVNPETGGYEKSPSCQSCPEPGTAHEDNWVWSPQYAIQMHQPETWGILQFEDSTEVGATYYREWPSRSAAMAIYYAQHAYAAKHEGAFTTQLHDLLQFSSEPFPVCADADTIISAAGEGKSAMFEATVRSPASPEVAATVRSDRYLTVAK